MIRPISITTRNEKSSKSNPTGSLGLLLNSTEIKAEKWIFSILKVVLLLMIFILFSSSTNAQCSLSCNSSLQVSIAGVGDCNATITPDHILESPLSCPGPKTVAITDNSGNLLPQITLPDGSTASVVSVNHVGQTLLVTVSDDASGNSCWSSLTVEEKNKPLISDCGQQNIFCFQNPAPVTEGGDIPVPNAEDCSPVSSSYYDVHTDGDCNAAYSAKIDRFWTFTDIYGNSNTCIQTIIIDRLSIAQYVPECPLTQNLECNANAQPNTHPDVTGYPVLDIDGNTATTNDRFTLSNESVGYCELGISYTDEVIGICGNGYKIIRSWTVYDWCVPSQPGVNPWTCIQIIKVEDTTPPVITPPADLTVGTSANDCYAVLNLPAATVSDNCSNNISVQTITPAGIINGNGGVSPFPGLELGINTITYVATDDCGNVSTETITVLVVDDVPPVPVCDVTTSVSLQADGTAIIFAASFDDGSHDNCGIASYEVRRMANSCAPESAFAAYAVFYCCDIEAGPVTVELKITDLHGNSNSCMVQVTVQDKINPNLICPPNIDLNCNENFEDLSVTGEAHAQDACGIASLTHTDIVNLSDCGEGTIQRVWTAIDLYGNSRSCTQWITLTNNDPFNIDDITWPADYETNSCGAGLAPENLPAPFNGPGINDTACDLIALTHEDTYLPVQAPGCFKILRKWIVIDWCYFESNTNNATGYWEYFQVLKVINSEMPEFTSTCENVAICSYEADCGSAPVSLSVTGSDDCTAEGDLKFNYEVDTYNDGSYNAFGNGNTLIGNYPLGTHKIKWYLEDGCGNVSTCEYLFIVEDCKKPTPYCLNGLAVELMPNSGTVTVWAEDFDAGSYDNCGIAEMRIFSHSQGPGQATPPAGAGASLTFDCLNLGTNTVDFWVLDVNGNWDYCSTYILVQDNALVCFPNETVAVAGSIENEEGETIEDVTVNIHNNGSVIPVITGSDGSFAFPDLNSGDDYEVSAEKNVNLLNGVSTFDLVNMSRHILGIAPLDSPYKMIAADINNSGSISAFDLVALRKVILNIDDAFPNNNSWRFIDKDFLFPNTSNPFSSTFPEVISLANLSQDEQAGFIGVKIGDVNGSAVPNQLTGGEDRNSHDILTFLTEERSFSAGEEIIVVLKAADFVDLAGFQFTLDFDPEILAFQSIENLGLESLSMDNFGINRSPEGLVTASWHSVTGVSKGKEEDLFQLKFEARRYGNLSEVLEINSAITAAEAYVENDGRFNLLAPTLTFLKAQNLHENDFQLLQNYPNPFKEITTVPFYLPQTGKAKISLFDLSGKLLKEIYGTFDSGMNEFKLKREGLQPGMIYYQLEAGTQIATKKMLVID